MKKKLFAGIILSLSLITLLIVSCSKTQTKQTKEKPTALKTLNGGGGIEITFGTKSHPTCDSCCSGDKGICIHIKISKDNGGVLSMGQGRADCDIYNGYMEIGIKEDTYEDNTTSNLTVENNIAVEPDVAQALGYSSVTILAGTYPLDYSDQDYPYGKANLDVELYNRQNEKSQLEKRKVPRKHKAPHKSPAKIHKNNGLQITFKGRCNPV